MEVGITQVVAKAYVRWLTKQEVLAAIPHQ